MTRRLHKLRRWLWMRLWYFDPVAAWIAPRLRAAGRCFDCGARLTDDEKTYYGSSCERCEGENMARAWGHE